MYVTSCTEMSLKRLTNKILTETWKSESFSRVMVNIVVIDQTNKHSHRSKCVDNYDSQRIKSFLSVSQRTALFSKSMCQVTAYRRLKTIENSKTVSQKSGGGRLQKVVAY